MRTNILFLWFILALVATSASMAGNRVSVLHNGYVTPIDGYEFLPGATDIGKRKVGSTVTLVECKTLTSSPILGWPLKALGRKL